MAQKREKMLKTQPKQSTTPVAKPTLKPTLKTIPQPTVTKKVSIVNRLGDKPKKINDRLGKRIEERLGKPLPKGTIVLGGHILGPKPTAQRAQYSRKTL